MVKICDLILLLINTFYRIDTFKQKISIISFYLIRLKIAVADFCGNR